MKHIKNILSIAVLTSLVGCTANENARIIKKGGEEDIASFMSIGQFANPQRIKRGEDGNFTLEISKNDLGYYDYISPKGKYYTLFIYKGDEVILEQNGEEIIFKGDNVAENNYLAKYKYLGYGKNDPKLFSAEWMAVRDNDIDSLNNSIDNAKLSEKFTKEQKAIYKYTNVRLRLEGPINAVTFRNETPELAPNYYNFLKDLNFEEDEIVVVPKWRQTMEMAFEQMERMGIIPVSTKNFLGEYATRIKSEKVRASFILELLNNTLEKGYSDDFPTYVKNIEQYIVTDSDKARLASLNAQYDSLKVLNKSITRGSVAPDFTAHDLKGKAHNLSDFKGKVVLVDFWFTGCSPCKAEMPHLEKIARDMQGQEITFISISVDTGDDFVKAWKEFVAKKGDETLNLLLPDGFKSPLMEKYLIKGVPRILIIDKDGTIVDAYARRPSDPKLRKQLEELVAAK